jgi:diamine N-acetyltransferase
MLLKTRIEDLFLRELRMDDLEGFYSWQSNPEITKYYAFTRVPRTLEETRRALASIVEGTSRDSVHLAIVKDACSPGEEFVGVTSLKNISSLDRHAEYAMVIASTKNMGKGYGKAASIRMIQYGFDTLNLRKIYMSALAGNEKTIHLYESIGFRREGVFRQHVFRDGGYEDLAWFSLFREEFTG